MNRQDWSQLSHLQIGRYAEYLVKMEFTLYGFDVYSSEVDDKGIDFVIRQGIDRYYDIQVKGVRAMNYTFFRKSVFTLRPNLLAAVVLFPASGTPDMYLIPSAAWVEPSRLFVSRDYVGKKSPPEWALNLSRATLPELEGFRFDARASQL